MEVESAYKPKNCTLEEAAAYLKVSKRTIQDYQYRGILKPVHFGKRRHFRWTDVMKVEKTGVPSHSCVEGQ